MFESENSFSVRRPLTDASIGEVRDATKNLSLERFIQRDEDSLGVSLVEKREVVQHMNGRGIYNTKQRYQYVFEPVIPSSIQELHLPVRDVRYLGRNMGRISLALVLDDENEILKNEHDIYEDRIRLQKQLGGLVFIPHVSIVKLPFEHATSDLLSSVESAIPDMIHLRPVTTQNPHLLPEAMQAVNRNTPSSSPSNRAQTPRHTTAHTILPVLSHPIHFLSTLRKGQSGDNGPATIDKDV